MKSLPMLNNLSHKEKDEIIISLWEEKKRLEAENEALKSKASGIAVPKKTSENSSILLPRKIKKQIKAHQNAQRENHVLRVIKIVV